MRNRIFLALCAAIPLSAAAKTVTLEGTGVDGATLKAQVVFEQIEFNNVAGDGLRITLTNIADDDEEMSPPYYDVPGNTLSGVFWEIEGSPTLTKQTATVAAGSSIIQADTCSSGACSGATDVGGEFGYAANGAGFPLEYGISSSGYIGGDGTLFGGTNLDDPVAPNGINFGIVSKLGIFKPNPGLEGEPLIKDSVVFVLSGFANYSLGDIGRVGVQYGTTFGEPYFETPLPGAAWLFGSALLAFAGTTRRRRVHR